jgi:plastocyanin
MKRIALVPLVLLALPFAAAPAYAGGGCFAEGPSALQRSSTVVIEHACFGTGAITVAPGATVTWRNDSDLEHNVSGPAIEFAELPARGTVTKTFATAGLYPYACTIHPGMSGVVVVGAVPSVAAAAPSVAPAAAVPAAPSSPSSPSRGVPVGAIAGGAAVVLVAGLVLVSMRRRDALPA